MDLDDYLHGLLQLASELVGTSKVPVSPNIFHIQSMTLGFGTYKSFGPVLMRTLLAQIHIH